MAILGFHLLIRTGKPEGRFENTTSLIVSGIYRYIRHPLYCSLLLGGTGAWLKDPFNLFGIGLVLINTMAIYFTSREEEKEMIKKFGNEYKVYMNSTKMFIPFLI
jgi:protein-S-isoprenylcysteine O-methyltransferase Ste14